MNKFHEAGTLMALLLLLSVGLANVPMASGSQPPSSRLTAEFNVVMPEANRTHVLDPTSLTAFYGFNIVNVGTWTGTATVNIQYLPLGWVWQMSFSRSIYSSSRSNVIDNIGAGESIPCVITLSASPDVAAANYLLIIQVQPQGSDYQVSVNATINQKGGVVLQQPGDIVTPAGETVPLQLTIKNNGNGEDNFTITLFEVEHGWPWRFDDGNSTTTGRTKNNATTTKMVLIDVPKDAAITGPNQTGVLVLIAVASNFDPTMTDGRTCRINVTQRYELNLSLPNNDANVTLSNDGNHTFKVLLKNMGNGFDNVSIVAAYNMTGWVINMSDTMVNLPQGTSGPFYLSVQPGRTTRRGQYNITIKATSNGPSGKPFSTTLNLSVTVRDTYRVSLYCKQLSASPNAPGDTIPFECKVENLGNGNDLVGLNVTGVPEGWSVTIDPSSLPLLMSQNRTVMIKTVVPKDGLLAKEGTYFIWLNATSNYDPLAITTLPLNITLGNVHDIGFSVLGSDVQTINLSKDGNGAFILNLANNGNTKVDVAIEILNMSWNGSTGTPISARLDVNRTSLGPNDEKTVSLPYTVPKGVQPGRYLIQLQAMIVNDPGSAKRLNVTVDVLSKDVKIAPLRFRTPDVTEFLDVPVYNTGQSGKVEIELQITNIGNVRTGPVKVAVFEKSAGDTSYRIIWNTTLDEVPIGETATLIVPWPQAASDDDPGDKDIRVNVSLDMDDNPDNNEVTANINVNKKPGPDPIAQEMMTTLALPLLSLVVLLVVIVLVLIKVRKKEGRKGK